MVAGAQTRKCCHKPTPANNQCLLSNTEAWHGKACAQQDSERLKTVLEGLAIHALAKMLYVAWVVPNQGYPRY